MSESIPVVVVRMTNARPEAGAVCAEKGTGLKAMKKARTLDSGVEAELTPRLLVRVLGGRWCS